MDLALRYPVTVQVVSRDGRDLYFGCAPNFGIETFEIVDPGNVTQEIMFHMKIRRMIREALSVFKTEGKEPPLIPEIKPLSSHSVDGPIELDSLVLVSTTQAASMLGVHPDTVRSLFDSGSLKGSLSKGGSRMILVASIFEEKAQMKQRAELRKFQMHAKKKNAKRRQRYVQKKQEEKVARLEKEMAEI